MNKVVITTYNGKEKPHTSIKKAAEYLGLKPQTVRNSLCKNKTNIYTSPDGEKTVKILRA